MNEYEDSKEQDLGSTRFYGSPRQEYEDTEYYQDLEDTMGYEQRVEDDYNDEDDLDPTVYYGSTDEDEDERETNQNIITFQRPKKAENDKPPMDHLSIAWNQALYLLDKDKLNEAYRLILMADDDFYLLRLMAKTGVCYKNLQGNVRRMLVNRVQELKKSEFINDLVDEFDREATKEADKTLKFTGGRGERAGTLDYDTRSGMSRTSPSDRTDFNEARNLIQGLKGRIGYVHPPQNHLDY